MFPSIINTNPKPSTPRALVSAGGLSTTSTAATAVSAATAARQQRIHDATTTGRFEAWHKADEPLWERRSPRFFNAQKYVRANPYPRLYRGSSTTGAQAPLSRRDEEERHIRPPTVSCTTPRRAVQTLLGERGEQDLIHRILPRDNNQQKMHLLSASSPPRQIQQQQHQHHHHHHQQQSGRKLSSPLSSGSTNNSSGVLPHPHVPRGVIPASSSSASTNSGANTRRPSSLQIANFASNGKSQQQNKVNIKRKIPNKNDCDSSEEDDAFDDPEYYSHQRNNKKNRESLFEMVDQKQTNPSSSSSNKKNSNFKNNNNNNNTDANSDDDDDDYDDQDQNLDDTFSRKSPDESNANRRGGQQHPSDGNSNNNKTQQQSAMNRRAFELLRRLFILQVGERSVTRAFLDKLPGVEVVERIEQVLGRVGASRFMSLDDFHLVLNQALCPSSGAANSALPSASEAIGGSLMSPRSGLRNKQKRTESFTEKQRKLNNINDTASPLNSQAPPPTLMISGVPTLETASAGGSPMVLQLQQSNLLKITNNSTKNQLGSGEQSNLQAPSLDATMNQTTNSLAVTYGANYRMTANQDKIHNQDNNNNNNNSGMETKKSPLVIPVHNNNNNNSAQSRGVYFGMVPPPPPPPPSLPLPPPPPLGGGGSSGIPMGFVDEDTSHITTTESRILFSLFESNGLVSIHQIKEGFDLLLRGEQYALQAYTRKIVCEPDNSEKESTVTVLELEWMLGAVCAYFAGDAELRECSGRLIANLWREAHQGCVARRTFRLAVLDDALLHRAITILPRYGSADAFALRPEQNAPLVADPMKMMSMTADMIQPHANNNNNNNYNITSSPLSPEASMNFPSKINNNNNIMKDSTTSVPQNANTKSGLKKIGSGVNFDPNVLAEDEKNIGRNNNNSKKSSKNNNSSSAGGGGRGLAFETLDLYDPLFKGDQCLSKDPTKLTDAATKEAGDPQFFSLRGQPYISVFGGPPQPIFDVRN